MTTSNDQGIHFKPGTRVRLKGDPECVGVVTDRTRQSGRVRRIQVQFPGHCQYVPDDQLERVSDSGDDPVDLFRRRRLGDAQALRRTITHARLTGRLADVIYSMDTTGTDFYAHQFKPVVTLMNSASRGILIADEVGLGKTIEAGLLWTELRTRFDFRRLLVLCPAMLCEKWRLELANRFGVEADILNAKETLTRLEHAEQRGRASGFAIVASLQGLRPGRGWDNRSDGAVDDRASSRLARFLDERSQDEPLVDLCVIDEAHYLRNRETMTSTLGRLVRAVSDYLVLLSATPIHLRSNDLFELLKLVDEHTFDRPRAFDDILQANAPLVRARDLILGPKRPSAAGLEADVESELRQAGEQPMLRGSRQLRALIDAQVWRQTPAQPAAAARVAERLERVNLLGHAVTRTRKRDVEAKRVLRDVTPLDVPLHPVEKDFYEKVTEAVRDHCMRRDAHEGFLSVTPQRQMSSSMPAALRHWLHDEIADAQDAQETGADPDLDLLASTATGNDESLRQELVRRAPHLGDLQALWTNDTKYQCLRDRLTSLFLQLESDRAEGDKVIVFSYFRATLEYLRERLDGDGIRATVLHGGKQNKNEIVLEFRSSPAIDVLLSSEVGSEGIDLQFARIVINSDLPWNPMRVEQRIGRIDRLGQRAEKIHVLNLFYQDTIDARIYERLFKRLKLFEESLGSLEPVLGDLNRRDASIQQLTRDLFSRRLTPEQEEERIEQTAQAIENARVYKERLENAAADLTAYGDYILRQVKAARDLHRSITQRDIQSYVTDFFDVHYPGSEFRQDPDQPARFDVSLSVDAKCDLAAYIRKERIDPPTRLTPDTGHAVRCRFENTAVPDRQGLEEVISQFHPLVRFVAARLEKEENRRRPAIAVQLAAAALPDDLQEGSASVRYAFAVQRWSVRGLRDMERLHYAATALGPYSAPIESSLAERLVAAAVERGTPWHAAGGTLDLDGAASSVESCIERAECAFYAYLDDLKRENDDRADVQQKLLKRHDLAQQTSLEKVLHDHRQRGQHRLVPATEGRLTALKARTERRRRDIENRRKLKYSPPEVMSVGVIDIPATAG